MVKESEKTDGDKIAFAISKLIVAVGMFSENQQRINHGMTQPYGEDSFDALADEIEAFVDSGK